MSAPINTLMFLDLNKCSMLKYLSASTSADEAPNKNPPQEPIQFLSLIFQNPVWN